MEQLPGAARRVAFFGGSFDPPHEGHLAIARAARAALELDLVLFAPVGAQPLKPLGSTASFEDRLAMTRLAIAHEPGFAVSLIDAPKADLAPNYTLHALQRLRDELPPQGELFCLVGADSFLGLRRWHGAAEIPFVARLIVAARPGQPLNDLRAALPKGLTLEASGFSSEESAGRATQSPTVRAYILRNVAGDETEFYLLLGLHWEISASQIRTGVRDLIRDPSGSGSGTAASRHALVPEAVLNYIRTCGLYQ